MTNKNSYTIAYSARKNILIPIKLWLGVFTLVVVPIVSFELLMNLSTVIAIYSTLIFGVVFALPGMLLYSLPNYFVQRSHFKSLKVEVNGDRLRVADSKSKATTEFAYHDVHMYERVRYPFTSYWAISMHVSEGRQISLGNSMVNYERLLESLKRHPHIKSRSLEKYVGGGIRNAF